VDARTGPCIGGRVAISIVYIEDVPSLSAATQFPQTVTEESKPIGDLIEGVIRRDAVTHPDERGTLTEVFNPAWDLSDEPLVYVYQVTIRPGEVKGWVVHAEQDDRLFFSTGDVKVVLFDDRPDSETFEQLNVLYFGESRRGLLRIPRGVYHAVQNVGLHDALFVNCPTAPYRHEAPDKRRLPLDTDRIAYRF
jgi:dTDP-4-dehydrorhamnose 3,5-epimerase